MSGTIARRQHTVNKSTVSRRAPKRADTRRTPAGDAFSELVVVVLRLHGLLTATGDALARPAGQTSARWQVLAGAEDGSRTVADVARLLGLARQSVQRVADVMESEGLIVYADNPRHRRARLLTLTDRGRRALDAIQAAQRGWADRLGAAVGEADLRRASEILGRVLAVLGHSWTG